MTDCIYRTDLICWDTYDQCEACKTCEFNTINNNDDLRDVEISFFLENLDGLLVIFRTIIKKKGM